MSLRDWSSPYNEQNVVATRAARKKVSLAQLNQVPEDDALADFQPMRPEPPEKKAEKAPEKDPYPPLAEPDEKKPVAEPWAPVETFVPQTDLAQQVAYMIQLLEEQRDEKTGHVTEEIILYLFLGIFVIFVVDTFVKTGRYSR
jgi:hypothetical protein